jgi:hypothetical protein
MKSCESGCRTRTRWTSAQARQSPSPDYRYLRRTEFAVECSCAECTAISIDPSGLPTRHYSPRASSSSAQQASICGAAPRQGMTAGRRTGPAIPMFEVTPPEDGPRRSRSWPVSSRTTGTCSDADHKSSVSVRPRAGRSSTPDRPHMRRGVSVLNGRDLGGQYFAGYVSAGPPPERKVAGSNPAGRVTNYL